MLWSNMTISQILYLISRCFLAFLGGISCCFPSGSFMFQVSLLGSSSVWLLSQHFTTQLLNDHTGTTILYFGIAELLIVSWLYGIRFSYIFYSCFPYFSFIIFWLCDIKLGSNWEILNLDLQKFMANITEMGIPIISNDSNYLEDPNDNQLFAGSSWQM